MNFMSHSSKLLNLRGVMGTSDFVAKLDINVGILGT